jgi:hypothetical protein
LNDAIYAAVKAADNEDGAPVESLKLIARDVDSLIDHGCTWAEMQDARALYEGANLVIFRVDEYLY